MPHFRHAYRLGLRPILSAGHNRHGPPCASPPPRKQILHRLRVENQRAAFPIGILNPAVFRIKRITGSRGPVNELVGFLFLVQRNLDPDIFQGVRYLAKELMDGFQPVGEHLMDPVLHRVAVAQIGNPDFATCLANALDSALALLQARRVPRQIDIDERTQALQDSSPRRPHPFPVAASVLLTELVP
jgi:hypothetical protein